MLDEEAAARLNDKDCFNLIFAPGFSTKTEISDVSGLKSDQKQGVVATQKNY